MGLLLAKDFFAKEFLELIFVLFLWHHFDERSLDRGCLICLRLVTLLLHVESLVVVGAVGVRLILEEVEFGVAWLFLENQVDELLSLGGRLRCDTLSKLVYDGFDVGRGHNHLHLLRGLLSSNHCITHYLILLF